MSVQNILQTLDDLDHREAQAIEREQERVQRELIERKRTKGDLCLKRPSDPQWWVDSETDESGKPTRMQWNAVIENSVFDSNDPLLDLSPYTHL